MAVIDPTVRHLYVHVPFCPSICPFCSFEVSLRTPGAVDSYLARIDKEARQAAGRFEHQLDTIYFGGGTPSYLRTREFERLVTIVGRSFGWASEVTLEVHPATVTVSRLEAWLELGITRLSLGLQSLDDVVLSKLGRGHDATTSRRALDLVLEAASRVDCVVVSADVMTAIGAQDVAADLAAVASSGVDHVSAYTLTIEPGTPFEHDGVEVDPTAESDAFDLAEEVLGGHGLRRYEVSNHARPGHECRHNRGYWSNAWWSALGPGASSHLPATGPEEVAVRSMSASLAEWLDGAPGSIDRRGLVGYLVDGIVAGLRRSEGVDLVELGERVGIDGRAVCELFAEAITRVTAPRPDTSGAARAVPHATFDGRRLRATHSGMLVLDQLAFAFVSPASDVKLRSSASPGSGG